MRILGDDLAHLRATRSSVKWRLFEPDVLPVWVAEMDAQPCAPVVEAVTRAISNGDTGYGWAPPFQEAFADFAARRWGWAVEPKTLGLVPDVMGGIAEILHLLPGDAVVVSPPCYESFFGFVESVRKRAVLAPLDSAHRLDPDALEGAFADAGAGAAYLLCNPQNPTGTVHTPAELAMLARLADRYDVQVISDEIHAPLTHPGVTFTPYLQVPEATRGLAVVSASKAWNLAGLKSALTVAGPECRVLDEMHEVVTHGANHLAVIAQTAAYVEGEDWLEQVHGELADNRRLLQALLSEALPQVRIAPAEATYLSWLDCTDLGLADPTATFLERGRVALADGWRYDPERGRQWARFNHATSPEVLAEAVRRMAASL
ncbi:MalY/PatB family protein [Nocardioides daejeonensis]|uniref:MalY/PatB family protein n=1 Tax=Nocardioides daejeonensis TaxID=1046556 RepID=UPI000D7479C1|nr:aminotransferase class I/II-fold pyridoxal phosphate-dependent enzyme [Nocardioides daejeonensis]